ncbi:MAG: hypothetical protein IJ109_05985 [Firmicutes bacterium]|nr:hypothetical protein [Bacillota bacterium]
MRNRTWKILVLACFITLVTVAPTFAAIDEQESNDNKSTANTISVGASVYGDIPYGDIDYYKFTAPISGTAKLSLWEDRATDDHEWDRTKVTVYDANQNEIISVNDSWMTDSGSNGTFGLSHGKTYYLKVHTFWGMGSGYSYSYHFKVAYSIGKTTITSVKGKKKALTVKWNKKAKASFYQVQYIKKGTYQDYGWNRAKTVKVSNKSKSRTIKKLAKKRTYYVRVRVARTISGVTYYSSWSPKRAVKTK